MKKVIITGIGGFIGAALGRKMLELGYTICGIDILENPAVTSLKQHRNFNFICSEYEKYESIDVAHDFDFFIHAAWAGVHGSDYNSTVSQIGNIKGSISAINLCKRVSCPNFMFIDSSHEYQKNINLKKEIGFCSIYGSAKKAARSMLESISHNLEINLYCVAFTNVYGPGDYSYRSTNVIIESLFNKGQADLIEGNNLHDWTYIDDAVNGMIAVCKNGNPNTMYYIGSRSLLSFKEIIFKVRSVVNPSSLLNFGKYNDTSFIDYSFFNLNKLYEDTGFECCFSVEEGTNKTLNWLKKIGRIK